MRTPPVPLFIALLAFAGCTKNGTGPEGVDAPNMHPDAPEAVADGSLLSETDGADATRPTERTEQFQIVTPGTVNNGLLVTAAVCANCHTAEPTATAMRDGAGRDISPVALWQGTMKANSARDPFFLATLSIERDRLPQYAGAVDAKCLTCHAPLATLEAKRAGDTVSVFALGEPTKRGLLGADGVTCTACHGISPEGAGTPAVWSGAHAYSADDAVYGPHRDPFTRPMEGQTGVMPTYGAHTLDSAQCASCHTLMTHALDVPDAPEFPEQTPFVEWLNSSFATAADPITCQDCHMPTADADGNLIATRIARRPGGGDFPPTAPRSPYGRHIFVGGNTLVPEIFKRYRAQLGVTAPDSAFDATLAAARAQLGAVTARVSLDGVTYAGGRVRGAVRVENLAGHKFPSGYPSRRAWLHVQALDAQGAVLFESGGWDAEGRITADGAVLSTEGVGGGYAPHVDVVTRPSDVQVWEAIMADVDGLPTIALLRAVSYLKDNRLLPSGWRADGPHAERTTSRGVEGDNDFVSGSDVVRLDFPMDVEPAELVVAVRYQVLGARWAAELFETATPDVKAFRGMVRDVGLAPERVGEARHRW